MLEPAFEESFTIINLSRAFPSSISTQDSICCVLQLGIPKTKKSWHCLDKTIYTNAVVKHTIVNPILSLTHSLDLLKHMVTKIFSCSRHGHDSIVPRLIIGILLQNGFDSMKREQIFGSWIFDLSIWIQKLNRCLVLLISILQNMYFFLLSLYSVSKGSFYGTPIDLQISPRVETLNFYEGWLSFHWETKTR